MEPVPLPPPYGGMNQKVPIITVQSPQCEDLFNFNITEGGVSLRKGDSKYTTFAVNDNFTTNFVNYGDTTLLAVQFNGATTSMVVYNVDTGALVYNTGIFATVFYSPIQFRNYLFFFSQSAAGAPGFYYDGAAFGGIGYTFPSTITSNGGTAYKNRIYISSSGTASYWYGGIDAIAGALTQVDLSSIQTTKSNLSIITPVTLADNISSVVLLAFVFDSGEVLFFSGSYPDATDWVLVGRANIPPPIGSINSYLNYQGDCLVFCVDGIYSLRDLFLKGSGGAVSLSISDSISVLWKETATTIRDQISLPTSVYGIYDYINNRIVIKFDYYVDNAGVLQGSAFFFIYNIDLKSWSYHRSVGMQLTTPAVPSFGLVYYNNKILYTNLLKSGAPFFTMVWEKEGSTGFQDRNYADNANVSYPYQILSAPISNGRAYVQQAKGIDAIIESDLYPQTQYTFVRDLGVQETVPQVIPTQLATLQKTNANIGLEGSFIQYKIAGTTAASKTVGYNLYGVNVWIENGSRPR